MLVYYKEEYTLYIILHTVCPETHQCANYDDNIVELSKEPLMEIMVHFSSTAQIHHASTTASALLTS